MGHAISNIIEGNWNELEGKLKETWGKLTDNDIKTIGGSYDRLAGKLKKTYGYTQAELQEQINSFLTEQNLLNFKVRAEELWENAVDMTDNVKDSIQRSARQIRDRSSEIQEDVVEYVKANPVKSVGFALVFGMVLSRILKRD